MRLFGVSSIHFPSPVPSPQRRGRTPGRRRGKRDCRTQSSPVCSPASKHTRLTTPFSIRLLSQLPILVCALALPPTVCGLDLTRAIIVTPASLTKPEQKAVAMLVEEVAKRTAVRWRVEQSIPTDGSAIILVGQTPQLRNISGAEPFLSNSASSGPAEGFSIRVRTDGAASGVTIAGNDSRGVLFGVGHLLRKMHLAIGKITIEDGFSVTTSPKSSLRGHQLGYRPKTNSYDAWDLDVW